MKFFAGDELNRLFNETIGDKLAMGQISRSCGRAPFDWRRSRRCLGLTPSEVSRHLE